MKRLLTKRWPSYPFRLQSTSSQDGDWLSKILPSQAFLKSHVRFPVHKERLSNRITELQMFHENLFSGRNMPVLDDSSWLTFFKMHNPEERVRYLLELSSAESTASVSDNRLISEKNEERHSRGEIVYAPGYNSIWELLGGDFRRNLDNMFVSRILAQERVNSSLPKLIVDCRFMRDYSVGMQNNFAKQINNAHNSNWNLRIPFNMSIANFSADSQLSDIVKRSWLFRYGPPSSRENFQSHPFYPSISARSVPEVADCAPGISIRKKQSPESIMYISSRATEFLPEEPPADVGAVVICASFDLQSWSSSLSAARKDGIRAYRIPFQRHSIIEAGQKTSHLFSELIPILSAFFSRNDIGEPIRSAISASLTPRKGSVREEKEFVEKYTTACKSLEIEQSRQQKYQQWLTRPAKPRVHRYSREERRQRQLA